MRLRTYWCVLRQSKDSNTMSVHSFRASDDDQALSVCHKVLANARLTSPQGLAWDGFVLRTIDKTARNIIAVTSYQCTTDSPSGLSTADGQ